jgi:hypothetical protein
MSGITFTAEHPWFANQREAEMSEHTEMTFKNIHQEVAINYMPSTVFSVSLYDSPNVTFLQNFPNVTTVSCTGKIRFNDNMFKNLDMCYIDSDLDETIVDAGQLTIKNAKKILFFPNCTLLPNSLNNVHAKEMQISSASVIPKIADGVEILIIRPRERLIQLPNIPNTLVKLYVPRNKLSEVSQNMIHDRNQKYRYLQSSAIGPAAQQVDLYEYDSKLTRTNMLKLTNKTDFTSKNLIRDKEAYRLRLNLHSKYTTRVANNILQFIYGDHYRQRGKGYMKKKRTLKKKRTPKKGYAIYKMKTNSEINKNNY